MADTTAPAPAQTPAAAPSLLTAEHLKLLHIRVHLDGNTAKRVRRFLLPPQIRYIDLFDFYVEVFSKAEYEAAWAALPVSERIHQARRHTPKMTYTENSSRAISVVQASEMSHLGFFSNLFSVIGWPHGWTLSKDCGDGPREVIAMLPVPSDTAPSSPDGAQRKFRSLAAFLRGHDDPDGYTPHLCVKLDASLLDKLSASESKLTELLREHKLSPCGPDVAESGRASTFDNCALDPTCVDFELAHIFPDALSLQNFRLAMYETRRYCSGVIEPHIKPPIGDDHGPEGESDSAAEIDEAARLQDSFQELSQDSKSIVSDATFVSPDSGNSTVPLSHDLHASYKGLEFFWSIFDKKPIWLSHTKMPLSITFARAQQDQEHTLSHKDYRRELQLLPALFANSCRIMYASFATKTLREIMTHRAGRLVAAQHAVLQRRSEPADGGAASHSDGSAAPGGASRPTFTASLYPLKGGGSRYPDYERVFKEWWVETGGRSVLAAPASSPKEEAQQKYAKQERQASLDILKLSQSTVCNVAEGYEWLDKEASSHFTYDEGEFVGRCEHDDFETEYIRDIFGCGRKAKIWAPYVSKERITELCHDYDSAVFFSAWALLLGKEQLTWKEAKLTPPPEMTTCNACRGTGRVRADGRPAHQSERPRPAWETTARKFDDELSEEEGETETESS